ncbi:NUMOD4 domain-containing protein [Bacillus thuringiensis]|uniref:NUMOD4 domain-containing protein n=1 Tax=Bacillus thuringiensis TaxID=1428 RepID=UPI001C92CC45|nr:NUMOD4 domain-containing protein [Bacillus thuringiensis]
MEKWKQIKGFGYEVSTYGRVRNALSGKILKQQLHDNKYYRITLYHHGKKINQKIHRLVAYAFIDNKGNKPFINHKDGNKLNNHVDNLEWCTNDENMKHALRTGLIKRLNKETVIAIYSDCWINQLPIYKIAKKYNVTKHTVRSIKGKHSYKDILKKIKLQLVIEA